MLEGLPRAARWTFYLVALAAALALDPETPLGVADWLIEVLVVWASTLMGTEDEITWVGVAATAVMLIGLWTSPSTAARFWIGVSNRLVAAGVIWAMVQMTRARLRAEQERRRAAAEIKILRGLLPICAGCKAIRNREGEWRQLEAYLLAHSEAQFTHSLCPDCVPKYFPGVTPGQA